MSEFAVPPATCGALCQHPGCWLAHKHAHRPQPPRSLSPLTGSQQSSGGGSLPTQNVVNLLGDYGFDKRDQFNLDTGQPLADRLVAGSLSGHTSPRRQQHRPSGKNWSGYMGPHVSPRMMSSSQYLRKSAEGATSRTTPTPVPVRPAQKVEVHEVIDFTDRTKAVNNLLGGSFLEYIWFPRPHRRRHRTAPQAGSVSKSGVVRAKDITKELLPQNFYKRKTKKKKRSSKNKSSGVPTGGQPYTSNRLSPRHEGLKGISQDTLIQLLQNAQTDPNLQKLLEKMMPGLKEALQEVARNSPTPPRQQSSILNHRKMTLLDAREKSLPPMPPRTLGTAGPWRLDPLGDRAAPGTGEPRHFKSPHPQTSREDVEPTSLQAQLERKYQKIYGDKRTSHPSPTQTVLTGHPHMTSVTPAYTAPWEEPAPMVARPFHYKNVPFDVVMAPVQRPPAAEQDQWDEATLESELASTIHVTMPTLSSPSPDDFFFSDQVILQERRHSRASMSSLQTSGTWPGKSFQGEDTARSNRSGAESPSHPAGATPDHSTAPTPTQLTVEPTLDTIHELTSQEDASSPDRKPFPTPTKPGSPIRRKPGSPVRRIPGSPTRRKPGSPLPRKPPSPIPQKQILTPPPPASSPEPWPSLESDTEMSGWSPAGGAFHPGQDNVGTPPSPQVVTAMKAARAQEEESSPAPPPPSPEPTPTPMSHKLLPLETLEEDEEDESGPESSRKDHSEPPSADRQGTLVQEPITENPPGTVQEPITENPPGTEDTIPEDTRETQESIEAPETAAPDDDANTLANQEDNTVAAVENSRQTVPEVSNTTEPPVEEAETAATRGVPVGGEGLPEKKDEENTEVATKPVENSGSNEEDTGQRGIPEGAEGVEDHGKRSQDEDKTVATAEEGVVEGGEKEVEEEPTSVFVVEAELAKLAVEDGTESNTATT